jgi:DNA polymerase-3 subunit beta
MTTTTANTLAIRQAQLKHGIASVLHAIDCDSSRYALGGVRVVIKPGEITFIATDGRRLAYRRFEFDPHCEPTEFTIPAKQARELARMYSTGTCTVDIRPDRIAVKWRNGRRASKLTSFAPLEGRFPKWQDVVADQTGRDWKGELSGPADLLLPFFQIDRKIDVRVNGRAEVYSPAISIGGSVTRRANPRANKKTQAISHHGQFDIRIDQDYVADYLRACGDSFVTIRVVDEHTAVYCESECGLHGVIMPMSRN